jgi:hypothetical protein
LELNRKPFGTAQGIHSALEGYQSQREAIWDQLQVQATKPLGHEQATAWLRDYLMTKRKSLGNEWVAKQVYWTLEAYFEDADTLIRKFPTTKPISMEVVERFRNLSALAPPISRLVSCTQKPHGMDSSDVQHFYQELQDFVDGFLQP